MSRKAQKSPKAIFPQADQCCFCCCQDNHSLPNQQPLSCFHQAPGRSSLGNIYCIQNSNNLQNRFPNRHYHKASKIQKLYSAFQKNYYLPAHLNSSQSASLIHYGECKGWHPKDTFNQQKYGRIYNMYEQRVQNTAVKSQNTAWPYAKSKIKYLLDEDKEFRSKDSDDFDFQVVVVER